MCIIFFAHVVRTRAFFVYLRCCYIIQYILLNVIIDIKLF